MPSIGWSIPPGNACAAAVFWLSCQVPYPARHPESCSSPLRPSDDPSSPILGSTAVAAVDYRHRRRGGLQRAATISRRSIPGQVVGIRQADNWRLTGPGVVACNAEDRDGLARLFDEHQFAAVLDCAGNCALKPCELDPAMAWRINVEGVRNLLSQTVPARASGWSICRSTWSSRAMRDGGYVEDDPTDPVTVYGKTMVAGEEADPARPTRRPASCGSRCRWASASTATPGRSTGSRRGSRSRGRPRSTSTRSARPPTPIA